MSAAAATAAAVGVGAVLPESPEVGWLKEQSGPDFGTPLSVTLPAGTAPQSVEVALIVETPLAVFYRSVDVFEVTEGSQTLDIPLIYPYEGFVLGDYAYRAVVTGDGFKVATTTQAGFTVSPFRWLS